MDPTCKRWLRRRGHDLAAVLLLGSMLVWTRGAHVPSWRDRILTGTGRDGFTFQVPPDTNEWGFWRAFLIQGRQPYRVVAGGEVGPFVAQVASNGIQRKWVVAFPYGMIVLLTGVPLGISTIQFVRSIPSLMARLRTHRRRRPGICRHCGYDLRATPDRCPECGRPAIP